MALGGLGWQVYIWERARVGYRTLRPSRGGVYGFTALEPRVNDVDGLTSKVNYFTVYRIKPYCKVKWLRTFFLTFVTLWVR